MVFHYQIFKHIHMSKSFGLVILPVVPVRSEPADQSELVTQLLYGETVEILESAEKWLYVSLLSDGYKGWVDKKMILLNFIPENSKKQVLTQALVACIEKNGTGIFYLPGGSLVPVSESGSIYVGGTEFIYPAGIFDLPEETKQQIVVELALRFLHAPYLWGGKSVLGIDCAALVQIVYSMIGIQLPRDAGDQLVFGEVVDFIDEAIAGDVAYFENSAGEIVHVGILISSSEIIHASGKVKVEKIDSNGIISTENGMYTHKLRVIKRLI